MAKIKKEQIKCTVEMFNLVSDSCGKIQPDAGKSNHSFACKTRKTPELNQPDAYQDCLFLYREFVTEALRLLIPSRIICKEQFLGDGILCQSGLTTTRRVPGCERCVGYNIVKVGSSKK